MKLQQVIQVLNELANEALAEPWDRVGLALGDPAWALTRAMLCIDLTEPVLAEAIAKGVNLIVAYHPPIFTPLAAVTAGDPKQRIILESACHRIALYSPHTALDAAKYGVNDWLAAGMGKGQVRMIQSRTADDTQYKIVTFVPHQAADRVRRMMSQAGAGRIGEYALCSYNLEGFGTFKGGPATHPTVGRPGRLKRAAELRIEMVCPHSKLNDVAGALVKVHPYEEPAYDVYPLKLINHDETVGQGRIVQLDKAVTPAVLIGRIKKLLGVSHVEVAQPTPARRSIGRVGLCPGAGGSLLENTNNLDAFVTGEMRHHDILAATMNGLLVILAGHTQTERPYLPVYRKRIMQTAAASVQWIISRTDRPVSLSV